MKKIIALLLIGAIAIIAHPKTSEAFPQFKTGFAKKYTKKGTAYGDAVKKAGCKVCHFGKKKADRNDYGAAIAKIVDGKKWKAAYKADKAKAMKEFEAVLDKVAKMKGAQGKTYGELIKAEKLPGVDKKAKED